MAAASSSGGGRGHSYSPRNLVLKLTMYALAALSFFAGGLVITRALSRLSSRTSTGGCYSRPVSARLTDVDGT